MSPKDQLITIETYTDLVQAYLARSRLEAAGIMVFLKDEFSSHVYGGTNSAIGGIKLQVNDRDAKVAKALLNQK